MKLKKGFLIFAAAFCAVIIAAGSGSATSLEVELVTDQIATYHNHTYGCYMFEVGNQYTLSKSVATPSNVDESDVSIGFYSTNEDVVTVDSDGIITPVGAGTAAVGVTASWTNQNDPDESHYASSSITIHVSEGEGVHATKIEFAAGDTLELDLSSDLSIDLKVDFTPENATTTTLTWNSSDPTVASVDENSGVITPHEAGVTEITATVACRSYNSISATCEVTVTGSGGNTFLDEDTADSGTSSGSGGSSGGCSAGFGTLALLAALPLLRMRKK